MLTAGPWCPAAFLSVLFTEYSKQQKSMLITLLITCNNFSIT